MNGRRQLKVDPISEQLIEYTRYFAKAVSSTRWPVAIR